MYLEELRLYTLQHRQVETEIAEIVETDNDCQNLMSHPGIGSFVAVAIKARAGDASDSRPRNTSARMWAWCRRRTTAVNGIGHNPVKHGDDVLKYALTCGVIGAVRAGPTPR